MKLDKRACRHAANVPLHISLNAGVLYTERVKYLVTAAVKLLGGHRVLAVYFYECERLKANDRMPKWVVFQGKDDFATLERDAEGNVKWRDSMLENLVDESFYKFRESCVFYKGTDGITISDFIHQSASGITILEALQVYQYGIRNKQAKKRRCKRDMGIVEKMKKVPAAPSNLARWIDRNVMPHYLFYSYDRNQPETQVFCTYCEKFSVIKKPKTGKIFVCPQCKQKAIAKAQGRRAAYHEDRETCQVIQKISDEELLIRIFKVRWAYKEKKNTPAKEIYENARLFIRVVGKEGTDTEAFYYDSSYDSTTHWRRGNRPRFSPYTSGYEADDTGAIYLPSLKRALQGTPWQYCALRQFYEPTKEAMQVSTYLRVYRRHPKLIEHLVKVGFERIVSDIVYRHGMGAEIDATQKRTHRILRVNKEDLAMLRELNAGVDTLKAYQQYVKLNLRGRQELLQWQLKNHVHTIPTQWFCNDIFNHTSLCEFHQGKLLLHLTIPFEEKPKTNLPSDNLRYYRQRKQMTTRQLAEKLNIVPATIVMYENGKHPIPYAVSIKLADVLEIEASLLYDDFSRFLAVPYTEALKSVRTALGLSQKAFAEQIGIVPSYYYKIEEGNRRPSRKVYQKICAALEATGRQTSLLWAQPLQ